MSWEYAETGSRWAKLVGQYVFLLSLAGSFGSMFFIDRPEGVDFNQWMDKNSILNAPISTWGPEEYMELGVYVAVSSGIFAFLAALTESFSRGKQGKDQRPNTLEDIG